MTIYLIIKNTIKADPKKKYSNILWKLLRGNQKKNRVGREGSQAWAQCLSTKRNGLTSSERKYDLIPWGANTHIAFQS